MFKRILSALGGKKGAATPANDAPSLSPSQASKELITVHDAYGREFQIARHEWQEKVLQPNLKEKWNEPDALYSMIVSALNDGFAADLLPT